MLGVRQNGSRMAIELEGVWNFRPDQETSVARVPIPGPLRDGELVAASVNYNDQKDAIECRDYYRWAYYQRTFTVPTLLRRQRLWLRFGAVAHSATVWLGDTLLYTHKGGLLPFEAGVTDLAESKGNLFLTVTVDNRLNHSTLPAGNDLIETALSGSDNAGIPSVEQAKRGQKPQNRPNSGSFNYAGILKPVYLCTTPWQLVKDITLVPDLGGNVEYETETKG